jgi:nicotinamide mononucleotide transporter
MMDALLSGIAQTSLLEWIAVCTGILSVWFSMRENILVYPVGIVSVLIYVWLGFQYKLYADMGVNFYYFIVSLYGWYHWKDTGSEREQIPVSMLENWEKGVSGLILLGSFGLLYGFLTEFTDSDVAAWDATTTAFFILAMWLMARKKVESWIAWIIGDLLSIPLYFYKGLVLTSFQFVVFTVIAIGGYIAWKKSMETEKFQLAEAQ